jgi:DNA-binding protein H-NS
MARPKSLTTMSIEALIQMRDDVGSAISEKAKSLRDTLASLGGDVADMGRKMVRSRKSKLSGVKVAPKYRGPKGELWAGRGAQPVWLRDALKSGKKAERFLIDKPAKKSPAKKASKIKARKVKKRAVARAKPAKPEVAAAPA